MVRRLLHALFLLVGVQTAAGAFIPPARAVEDPGGDPLAKCIALIDNGGTELTSMLRAAYVAAGLWVLALARSRSQRLPRLAEA